VVKKIKKRDKNIKMIITNEKIEVNEKMMNNAGMIKYSKYGIPVDPKNIGLGLICKSFNELKILDLDKLEEYFINILKNK